MDSTALIFGRRAEEEVEPVTEERPPWNPYPNVTMIPRAVAVPVTDERCFPTQYGDLIDAMIATVTAERQAQHARVARDEAQRLAQDRQAACNVAEAQARIAREQYECAFAELIAEMETEAGDV